MIAGVLIAIGAVSSGTVSDGEFSDEFSDEFN